MTTVRGAAAAAAAALLLSSCGSTAPGVAAEVEGQRITDQQVDDFAEVLCAIGGVQGSESGVPTRSARFASLQILFTDQLAEDAADVDAVSQTSVASILQGMAAARDLLSSDQQATFDDVAKEFARAQTATLELGRQSLIDAGQPAAKIADDAAYAEGQRLLAKYAEGADVEVDPRFGELVDGSLQPGNGSLSVPVSDLAVKADDPQAGDEFVSLLPASQKCEPAS
jgi:hypothetical protein